MLLAQVHSAHARAQDAVKNGNEAYDNVLAVKKTLESEFAKFDILLVN